MSLPHPLIAQAWIFDLDDTLFLESEFVLSGFMIASRACEKEFGVPIFDELQRLFAAGQRATLFNQALATYELPQNDAIIARLIAAYREHAPAIFPFPDVIPLLEKLKSQGKKIGLVSDGWCAVQRRKFHALHLDSYFSSQIFTDCLGGRTKWKPAPDGYLACLAELAVAPEAAVYIGDNPAKDFLGARNTGIASIRVRRRNGEHFDVEASGADAAPDLCFDDLDTILGELNA